MSVSTVAAPAGRVQGMEKDGVVQFRGIPFAVPPVGELRFRPTRPLGSWDGTLDATRYGALAPQNPSPIESMLGASTRPTSEDCLTLNVWTPAVDEAARPVMVWIHGGAYEAGTGSIPWYDGSSLARNGDVVVVTINYRLGALGFLHLADVLGDDYAESGLCGTLDQVLALEWVRDNIAAFGGDPGNVTIFGESAGGMSVGTLLGVPAARGLFHHAIAQSGATRHVWMPDEAAVVTGLFLDALGTDDVLSAPVERILAAQQAAGMQLLEAGGRDLRGGLGVPFRPVIGTEGLPRHPLDAVRDGEASDVTVIAGSTAEEWNLFLIVERQRGGIDDDALLWRAERIFGAALGEGAGQHAVEVYRRSRPGASAEDIWCALATDWMFRIPAIRLLEAQSVHQPNAFGYVFSHRSTAFGGVLGACHAVEIPFAFDNLHRKGVELFLGEVDDDARATARAMSSAWLSFARTGDPEWPRYDVDRRATMNLCGRPEVIDDPGRADRELWEGVQ
jgi:para-nitrobenzyl esterase